MVAPGLKQLPELFTHARTHLRPVCPSRSTKSRCSIDIALPRGQRPTATMTPVTWHRFDESTYDLGRQATAVAGGLVIGTFNPERTICDAYRLRHLYGEDDRRSVLTTGRAPFPGNNFVYTGWRNPSSNDRDATAQSNEPPVHDLTDIPTWFVPIETGLTHLAGRRRREHYDPPGAHEVGANGPPHFAQLPFVPTMTQRYCDSRGFDPRQRS